MRRERLRIAAGDLRRLRRENLVSPALRPIVAAGEAELKEWLDALRGVDEVSPMRRALLEDACALGVAFRAEIGRFLHDGEPPALERVATLANSRRSNLVAAGLDRAEADPLDLGQYLQQKATQDAASKANGGGPDPEVTDVEPEGA